MAVAFDLDFDKVIASVTILASRGLPELSKGKICKLLFLADRAHTVKFGRPITGDRLCALPHGPILSVTLNMLNMVECGKVTDQRAERLAKWLRIDTRFTHPRYAASAPAEMDALSDSDVSVLEDVIAAHGAKTFKELRNFTHDLEAYRRAWDSRGEKDKVDMNFEDLFEDEDADDIVVGAKEEMLENFAIVEALSGYHR